MKNTISTMKNSLKEKTNLSKEKVKKISQAISLWAMLALGWCDKVDETPKTEFKACEFTYGEKRERCNKRELRKQDERNKRLSYLYATAHEVYDVIADWKEPFDFLRRFNLLESFDQEQIVRELIKNEKIKTWWEVVNEKYFTFIMYLIEKNNLEWFERSVNLFGNLDLGTLITYKKYSDVEVTFENLKYSDYFYDLHKHLHELNLKQEDFTEDFIMRNYYKGGFEYVYNIMRAFPGDIKDFPKLKFLLDEAMIMNIEGKKFWDGYEDSRLLYVVDKEYLLEKSKEFHLNNELSENLAKIIHTYHRDVIDVDFIKALIKNNKEVASHVLYMLDMPSDIFNNLSKEEQDIVQKIKENNND